MYQFGYFCDFVKKTRHFLQNTVLDKKLVFWFLAISLAIFDLQRRTISHFNPLNISFWPFFITFSAKMDIWWDTKRRKCLVFFFPDFTILTTPDLASNDLFHVVCNTQKTVTYIWRKHVSYSRCKIIILSS